MKKEGVSHTIWIPLIWMLIAGSRFVSHWLNLGSPHLTFNDLDGSPVDRTVFLVLIVAGIIVLAQRKLNWSELFKRNIWVWLFFVYGAISFAWSDFPFVAFKRWFKALGNVIMALIILTEERPLVSLGAILRRYTFLLLPLSVLLIKYYPALGRSYHEGEPTFTGVAMQKNLLGIDCLISGIYFSWNLLLNRLGEVEQGRPLHFSIYLIILPMIIWLFSIINTATALTCIIVAVVIFIVARQPVMVRDPIKLMIISLGCIILYVILDIVFDVKSTVIAMLGRRPDLTTRVPIWEELLKMAQNPLVGFGYESFWMGLRQQIIIDRFGLRVNAHNGYLQMYLDLGYIGLFFVAAWILFGLRKVSRDLLIDYPVAVLWFCFIVVVSLLNYTDASFYGVNNMWLLLLLAIMNIPNRQKSPNESTSLKK